MTPPTPHEGYRLVTAKERLEKKQEGDLVNWNDEWSDSLLFLPCSDQLDYARKITNRKKGKQ